MRSIKISFIGGGGLRTLGMVRDWFRRTKLSQNSELVIMDMDKIRAETVAGLSRKMPEARLTSASIRATTDIKDALDGADFVYLLIRVGGVRAMEIDKAIGVKYGFHGHDDFGPAGVFLSLRTIPVLLNITKEMEKRCPKAWLLIFTNPEPILTNAVCEYSNIRTVGLCGGSRNIAWDVGRILGIKRPYGKISYRVAGINHFGWALDCTQDGKDVYPEFRERFKRVDVDKMGKQWKDVKLERYMRWYVKVVNLYGYFPYASAHCFHWFYHDEMVAILKDEIRKKKTRAQLQDQYQAYAHSLIDKDLGDDFWKDKVLGKCVDTKELAPDEPDDIGMGMIAAMLSNSGEERVVTLRNDGAIPNLPDDAFVETSVIVKADGPHPIGGAIPAPVADLTRAIIAHQKLVIKAALSGRRNELLQAVMADPVQRSLPIAEKLIDELLSANQRWLPDKIWRVKKPGGY